MRVELRADHVVLDGYVTAAGRDSRVLASPRGRFVEQVEPGTFRRALERGPVELRFNHQKAIGGTEDGTLELREDNIGLRATAMVSDPEVMEAARKGELRGWSPAFYALKDRWEDWQEGIQRRFLEDIRLKEVSILTVTPAYIATTIEERDGEAAVLEERSTEDPQDTVSAEPQAKHKEATNQMAAFKRRRLQIGGKQ